MDISAQRLESFISTSEKKPETTGVIEKWKEIPNWDFFLGDWENEWVILLLLTKDWFLQSAFVPNSDIKEESLDALLSWNFSLPGTWEYGIRYSGSDKRLHIYKPLDVDLPLLRNAEPSVISRYFDGYPRNKRAYLEINNKILHISGLHWVSEKSAYCTLDEMGDLAEGIIVKYDKPPKFVLVRRHILDKYLNIADCSLVRFFEVRRSEDWIQLHEVDRDENVMSNKDGNIRFRLLKILDEGEKVGGIFYRGGEVSPSQTSIEETLGEFDNWKKDKRFETFLILDFKNRKLVETNIGPGNLTNYFTQSDLPFETSPVFFKAEVLKKYKDNTDKYDLGPRQIYCRGAWGLKTYDINDAGQVHTYACYLAEIPYKEQLHWKQYNEKPKAGISKRAFKTDFEGQWCDQPEPILELQKALKEISERPIQPENKPIWQPKEKSIEETFGGLFYVVTSSKKEWSQFNVDLAIAVNEGFQTRVLKNIAERLGAEFNSTSKSIGLLNAILNKIELDTETIDSIIKPIRELQRFRSGSAHGGIDPPPKSLIEDAKERLEKVTAAIKDLRELVCGGKFDAKIK